MNWIDRDFALIIHARVTAAHGGAQEMRDESALIAGLHRARNLHACGEPAPDIADLAAIHTGGIVLNRPFVDGNKRAGFMAAYMLLRMNGHSLHAPEVEAVLWTLKLAARACGESDYAGWLRSHMKKTKAVVKKPGAGKKAPVKKRASKK